MTALNGVVFVIDDDEAVRKSLKRLLRAADYETEVSTRLLIIWRVRRMPDRRAQLSMYRCQV